MAASRRSRSVQPVIAASGVTGWRAQRERGMKRRDHRWQVHRFEDLFGDGLGLDERDEAELVIPRFEGRIPSRVTSHLCASMLRSANVTR
jgi:hypothetical protein